MTGAAAGWTWSRPGPAWWAGLPVPRAPHPDELLRPGAAVPIAGSAARDADGDGVPDTLLVQGTGGMSLWTDLDADGFADRVTVLDGPAALRAPDDDPDPLGLLGALVQRLTGA